ncbi:AraC family transcriptional regulator [Inconstantimicrobium mannanitabidum]|uniref:AraC family transcriptional regulator n=1 Tax=Inconstantimicrobium mannanitabidum TaxID=1604901 RepID=A0ACB5R997_9CLOT|nr:AraC family transcriptional regulator [Clostridium sp. TW13]GKX65768.1 AraC family transcriptional regulator [Clostridium sp. TW13]
MDSKDLDIYLRKFNDMEYNNLETLTKNYNFNSINETLENFKDIKISSLDIEKIIEIPNLNLEKLSFIKHNRFAPVNNHKHKFIEMSYIYSGQINEVINGTPITLKKGDLIILDTNVIHSVDVTGTNDIMLNFLINREYFNNSFFNYLDSENVVTSFLLHALYESHKYNTYLIFDTEKNEFIHNIICKLTEELIAPNLNSTAITDSCVIILFSELLRIYNSQEKNKDNANLSKQTKLAIEISNYISSNYETISLASAAKHFHFTPNYFSNIVKKYTGQNFKDLILDERLKKSSYLLRNTNLTIEEVIEKVGISNIQFFYKKFKEHFGVTPHKYRK